MADILRVVKVLLAIKGKNKGRPSPTKIGISTPIGIGTPIGISSTKSDGT